MTPLFIKFINDDQGLGHCKFKFNEKIVNISNIDELEDFFNIFLKHIRFSYEYLNLSMNERLGIVADKVNREYPKFREKLGYIKTDRDKFSGFKGNILKFI
jgi:hypothetical protein